MTDRDALGVRWLIELLEDLRYSVRALARAPAFTLSAVLVLALGIGGTTAVLSAVDAVLLARLPYPDDQQLVRIYQQNSPTNRWTLSAVDVQAIERHALSFSAVGASRGGEVGASAGGEAERVVAGYLTAGFLDALGVGVIAGRRHSAQDELPGNPPTVVLGAAYAIRKFGSARAAIDRTVTIEGVAHRVVGVLSPADARLAYRRADLWPILKRETPARRGPFGMFVIARMRPGVTVAAARRELEVISVRIFPLWQAGFQDRTARLTPYSLRETIVGSAKRPMTLFVIAVSLVLLIAVSNVASLTIVRAMRRWREISLRAALGASRARLTRLLVAESVTLAAVAGALGVAVGWGGLKLLQGFAAGIPRLDTAHIDLRSVAIAVLVSLGAGLAIGGVSSMRLFSSDSGLGLRDAAGTRAIGDTRHAGRLRAAFVAAQFAFAFPVLAAGALLLESIVRLQRVDPGFDPAGAFIATVSIPRGAYPDSALRGAFWMRVAGNVAALPGVAAAGFGTATPPNDNGNNNENFDLVDFPVPPGGAQPTATWPRVTPEFFAALGVPLLEGRMFNASDTAGGVPVVLVTRSWAARHYRRQSPVGRQLIRGGCLECPRSVIIGVVGDVTFDRLDAPGEAMFSPLAQDWPTQMHLFVRVRGSPGALVRRVGDAVRSADPRAAMGAMQALGDRIYDSVAQPRHWATILLVFAATALVMAAVGVFGLLSYAVELRRREIGVRMALGASSSRVVRAMVASGLRHAGAGAVIGIALTFVVARWLEALLYEVSAFDPRTLLAVMTGMLGVALIASWIPARRAAAIDPVEAMRSE